MNKKVISIILRYLMIILVGLGNLYILYKIFHPLTFYSSSFLLSLFGEIETFYGVNTFLFNTTAVEVVNACVAGSAYYLLFILCLSTPNLNIAKRIAVLAFSWIIFLIINVIRIALMTLIAGTIYFESIHLFFWYLLSLVFVVGVWFLSVKIFSIKETPVYSDITFLIEQIKYPKRKSKNNKSRK